MSMISGKTGKKPDGAEGTAPVLATRERMVLAFIETHLATHGAPPTMREIGAACGVPSTRSVSDYLKNLERAGRIRRRNGRSRGIELVEVRGRGGVPLLGRIAAGAPLAADALWDGDLPVDSAALFGASDCFAVTVSGDSMVGRHILSGDQAVIRPQSTAHPGDVVAVEIDGEVTLKTYREDGETVILMPANDAYSPIVLNEHMEHVRILGVMVGLVRGGGAL